MSADMIGAQVESEFARPNDFDNYVRTEETLVDPGWDGITKLSHDDDHVDSSIRWDFVRICAQKSLLKNAMVSDGNPVALDTPNIFRIAKALRSWHDKPLAHGSVSDLVISSDMSESRFNSELYPSSTELSPQRVEEYWCVGKLLPHGLIVQAQCGSSRARMEMSPRGTSSQWLAKHKSLTISSDGNTGGSIGSERMCKILSWCAKIWVLKIVLGILMSNRDGGWRRKMIWLLYIGIGYAITQWIFGTRKDGNNAKFCVGIGRADRPEMKTDTKADTTDGDKGGSAQWISLTKKNIGLRKVAYDVITAAGLDIGCANDPALINTITAHRDGRSKRSVMGTGFMISELPRIIGAGGAIRLWNTVCPLRGIDTVSSQKVTEPITLDLNCPEVELDITIVIDTGATLCCVHQKVVDKWDVLKSRVRKATRGSTAETANGWVTIRHYIPLVVINKADPNRIAHVIRFWILEKLPHDWILSRCAMKQMRGAVTFNHDQRLRISKEVSGSFRHECAPRDEQWRDPIDIPSYDDVMVRSDMRNITIDTDGMVYGTTIDDRHEVAVVTSAHPPPEAGRSLYQKPAGITPLPVLATQKKPTVAMRTQCGSTTVAAIKHDKRGPPKFVIKIGEEIGADTRGKLISLLRSYNDLASQSSFDVGTIPNAEFEINLVSAEEIRKRKVRTSHKPYRANPAKRKEIERTVKELLEGGIIELCHTATGHAYPVCLAKKGDGKWRMCIDFRALNAITIRDSFPLPNITDTLQKLQKCRFFSKFDIRSAYYHIPIRSSDLSKSTFVTESGTYRLKRMAFGLANAPPHFQRIMTRIFGDIEGLVVYIDDITIASDNEESHLVAVAEVFSRCRSNNIKLRLDKCELFQPKVEFLGHVVTPNSISIDRDYKHRCLELKKPTNVAELRRFMGMIGWIGRFIPHLGTYTAPLNSLRKKSRKWDWNKKCDEAFFALRDAVRDAKILGFPLSGEPFIIECDASNMAVGAVLLQKQNDKIVPIEYLSKTFGDSQMSWTPAERELFAVLYSVSKWHHYIACSHFTVLTDHKNLIHLFALRGKDVNTRLWRWATKLSEYDFTAKYIPGPENIVADFLSRNGATVLCLEVDEAMRIAADTNGLTVGTHTASGRRAVVMTMTRGQVRRAAEAAAAAAAKETTVITKAKTNQPPKNQRKPTVAMRTQCGSKTPKKKAQPKKKALKQKKKKKARKNRKKSPTPSTDGELDQSWSGAEESNANLRSQHGWKSRTDNNDEEETNEVPAIRRSSRLESQRKDSDTQRHTELDVSGLPQLPKYPHGKYANDHLTAIDIAFESLRARTFYSQLLTPAELVVEVKKCEWTQKIIRALKIKDQSRLTRVEKATLREYRVCTIRVHGRLHDFLYFKERLVVPVVLRKHLLRYFHHYPMNAHQGIDRMTRKIGAHYHWPKMKTDIRAICEACMSCQCCKIGHNKKRGECQQFTVYKPWKIVHVDLVGPLPPSPRGNIYIMSMMDRFSSFVVLIPLKTKESREVTLAIVEHWICRFGVFSKLLSDNGTEFASRIGNCVAELFKFDKIWTSVYHPATNGKLERFHKYLKERIVTQAMQNDQSAIDPENPYPWDDLLPYISASYNTTPNRMTNYSPFEVIFGVPMRLPDQLMLEALDPITTDTVSVETFKKDMKVRIKIIRDELIVNQERYDRRRFKKMNSDRVDNPFKVGDLVLRYIGDMRQGNKSKLEIKYDGPWTIVRKINDKAFRIKDTLTPFKVITMSVERLKRCPDGALQLYADSSDDDSDTVDAPLATGREAGVDNDDNEQKSEDADEVHPTTAVDAICSLVFPSLVVLDTTSADTNKHEQPNTLSWKEQRIIKVREVLTYAFDRSAIPSKRTIHTPTFVAKLMAKQRGPKGKQVLDFMAGDGALAEAVIGNSFDRLTAVTCVEKDRDRVYRGQESLPQCIWQKYDILSDEFVREFVGKKYDFIITNPEFAFALPALILCSELLAPNGVLCVLLPSDYFQRREKNKVVFEQTDLRIRYEYKIGKIPYYDNSLNTRRFVDSIFVMGHANKNDTSSIWKYTVEPLPEWFKREKKEWRPSRLLCILAEDNPPSDEE